METFAKFYYDVALSTSRTALYGLLQVTTPDHVLFGSDFPYAPLPVGMQQVNHWDKLLKEEEFQSLKFANWENAEKLFGGLEPWIIGADSDVA